MAFTKAVKHAAKLRMAVVGPSGSGKTWTSLEIARALADGQPVAVVDTERGSASKYADVYDFDVLELDNFHPNNYIQAMRDAAQAGYAVVVLDSLSHAWNGKGGILEIVQRKGNSFQAWGEVKPIENALIEAIVGASIHVIATMRSKTEYVVETNDKGKAAPRKVGVAPVQRDGLEYEFDVFGELDQENTLTINKTRCPALTGAVIAKPGKPLADTLKAWLTGVPAPAPALPAAPRQRDLADTPAYNARPAHTDAEWDRMTAAAMNHESVAYAREAARQGQAIADKLPPVGTPQTAEPATDPAFDPWAEVRELAAKLALSDEERATLFKRHKKQPMPILAELHRRHAQEQTTALVEPDVDPEPVAAGTDLEALEWGHAVP